MIASINGSSIGADGTSESLSNRVDRAILGVIRSQADAVVVGAASVRAEGYVVPRSAPLAIVSASGDLTGHRLQLRPGARVLLLVPDDRFGRVRPPAQGVDVIAVPSSGGRMSVPALLAVLASHGMHRVVCEGGPSLTAQFVAAGVVDEICLTTAPQVFLPGLPVMSGGTAASAAFRLQQFALDDSGFSYARWLRDEPVPRASR
ncbi:dihydrofolate reductase family protein [Microbacteriaceae bacterium VKM Ac-2855]|nr:dihydrofolate reductase family protein [Microbacteriaceae bacterium VKM Ac-2855]